MKFKQALARADAYCAGLRADDQRFQHSVIMQHRDRSTLFFERAFLMRIQEWVVCFTEHHGARVYHLDDLTAYAVTDYTTKLQEVPEQ